MKLIRASVPWDEVAACWVRAELGSERFAHLYERTLATNPEASATQLLSYARGWPSDGYFEHFPADITWHLVALAPREVASVLYIDWEYWNDVSNGTRRPADAIANMDWAGGPLPAVGTEPLILVADAFPSPGRVVVLEGHSRLTGYVARLPELERSIECYLGVSSDIVRWSCF